MSKIPKKKCAACKRIKSLFAFYKANKGKYNVQNKCKKCQNKYSKEWFQNNKVKLYPKRCIYKREYKKTARGRYHTYTGTAKKRGIPFKLSFERFNSIITQKCRYCDEYSEGLDTSGVDRLDNDIGYILTNCVPCCSFCNTAKSDHSEEYFLNKMRNIYNIIKY